jgi:hypothetical protein
VRKQFESDSTKDTNHQSRADWSRVSPELIVKPQGEPVAREDQGGRPRRSKPEHFRWRYRPSAVTNSF